MSLDFENNIARYIGEIKDLIHMRLVEHFEKNGVPLTPVQFQIMTRIWREDGLQQHQLATAMKKNNSSLSRLISTLEKKGFVRRVKDDSDSRAYKILLTPEGVKWKRLASDCAQNAVSDMNTGFTVKELETLQHILVIIRKNLLAVID